MGKRVRAISSKNVRYTRYEISNDNTFPDSNKSINIVHIVLALAACYTEDDNDPIKRTFFGCTWQIRELVLQFDESSSIELA